MISPSLGKVVVVGLRRCIRWDPRSLFVMNFGSSVSHLPFFIIGFVRGLPLVGISSSSLSVARFLV